MSKDLGEKVVDKDLYLKDRTDIRPGMSVDGYDGFRAELAVFGLPENTGVDRAGGRLPTPVEWRTHRKLDERNHIPEGTRQADILHMLLQIGHAVFQGKTPLQRIGIERTVGIGGLTGNRHAEDAGQRKRLEVFEAIRQVAQT